VINAVPFSNYTSLNPSDYQDGKYNGLSAIMTRVVASNPSPLTST
jgi:hypothetical protein